MRVCSIYVSLAHGLGGFVRDVLQTKTLFSTRRWTDGIVKKKVLYSPYTTSVEHCLQFYAGKESSPP